MKKGDKIAAVLILILIIASCAGVFIYHSYVKGSHKIAVIKQDGKIIDTIDLTKMKTTKELTVKYNKSHYNLIEIENGKIRIKDADCPDKICVKTGWISEPGQSIICLPHKLIIKIEGNNSKYDDISS